MSKHTNKHWIREKEFISLKFELSELISFYPTHWRRTSIRPPDIESRISEIESILDNKFYNEERGKYKTAPRWYRRMKNRIQRAKSKQVLHKILKGEDNIVFSDGYKDAPWYW